MRRARPRPASCARHRGNGLASGLPNAGRRCGIGMLTVSNAGTAAGHKALHRKRDADKAIRELAASRPRPRMRSAFSVWAPPSPARLLSPTPAACASTRSSLLGIPPHAIRGSKAQEQAHGTHARARARSPCPSPMTKAPIRRWQLCTSQVQVRSSNSCPPHVETCQGCEHATGVAYIDAPRRSPCWIRPLTGAPFERFLAP